MNVAITGGSGFIGSHLTRHLSKSQNIVTRLDWRHLIMSGRPSQTVEDVLKSQDIVIHTAAIAHDTHNYSPEKLYQANHLLTKELAKLAVKTSIKRVIYLSTAYVHGTHASEPVNEESSLRPNSYYAESKLLGEMALKDAIKGSTTTYTIIRPPPVYGPDAPGNFGKLKSSIKNGVIFPYAHKAEKRSYISIENLIAFILHSLTCKMAENQTYLVSDKVSMAFPDILRRCACETGGHHLRLLPLPAFMMKIPMTLMGRSELYRSLFERFEINQEKAIRTNWIPG
ncbi:NAD-dependent epimerase/dehydratase family protein [Alcanivorax quisquiliarum]|uniref:NAD-dependent epimerase/dehydratase family protein n=1 Tax=Alcanivorax quisquiliarum TaxID=2933565 RepID=A0ABT0E3J8_9GAMM|nr:NAD-dependent epimerase/dehydratase family protein [Alcanivorax quisquiliarum]MCK0536392.1 NAD-dependent epimerase/dehydratase family protein [Alcanivorax quisquiliarum]